MASKIQKSCAVCGKPANSKCTGCKTDSISRHYCGAACQKNDWPTHKTACKAAQDMRLEKSLARVADIIQRGYYEFRQNTWDTPILKVEDRDDALVITDGVMLDKSKYFISFPQHMVTSERTKAAMLCAWMCNEPLAFMHDLVTDLVKGLDIHVEEVCLGLGRIPRKISYNSPHGGSDHNWPNYFHEALRITSSRSKKQWVIDISGAQYGITRVFWTWGAYVDAYNVNVKKIMALGFNKAMIKDLSDISGNPSMSYGVVGVVAEHMNEASKKWAIEHNISLSDLLTMEEEEFRQAKDKLLQNMSDAVRGFLKANKFDKEFQAAKAYEYKYPGLSGRKCLQTTAKY
ncbi:zf-MYND domain containing protein [Pyrenophora teres f. maculata]|nr:zf-MYND domain containing protein [Pyrenophora teres f. maculata]